MINPEQSSELPDSWQYASPEQRERVYFELGYIIESRREADSIPGATYHQYVDDEATIEVVRIEQPGISARLFYYTDRELITALLRGRNVPRKVRGKEFLYDTNTNNLEWTQHRFAEGSTLHVIEQKLCEAASPFYIETPCRPSQAKALARTLARISGTSRDSA